MSKKIHLKFIKSINKLLIILSIIAVALTLLTVIIFVMQNRFSDIEASSSIKTIINILVITLPIGLFIVCLAVSILFGVKLSKKSIRVQNLSAIEALSEIDVLCVDKIGALTSGELEIKKVIPLKAFATEEYIAQHVSNVLRAINEDNLLTNALKKEFDLELSSGVIDVFPFSKEKNYCGASFKGGKTIVIGNPEFTPIKNKAGFLKRCSEYINNGQRVLVVAEGKKPITNEGCLEELDPIAIIVLKDKIRNNTFETLKWFNDNNTIIKVVSSDDAIVASVVAAEAGIKDANRYVSLEGLSIQEVKEIAKRFVVFGNVNPEQKKTLISAFKEGDHKVAMIGSDSNDIPAMKSADCSIAFDNVEETTKNAADIVVADSSFSPLLLAITESRKYIYDLFRVAFLCVTKTLMAFLMVLIFNLTLLFNNNGSIQIPFVFNHFLILDIFTNGLAAFALTLEKRKARIDDSFIKSVFKKVIPAFALLIIVISVLFTFYVMQEYQSINVGFYSLNTVYCATILFITVMGIVFLYSIASPLNKYRTLIVALTASINVIALLTAAVISYITNKVDSIFQIPFLEMNGPAYLVTIITMIVSASIYIFINHVVEIKKGENVGNED